MFPHCLNYHLFIRCSVWDWKVTTAFISSNPFAMLEWSPTVQPHLVEDGLPVIPFAVLEADLMLVALWRTHGATLSFIFPLEATWGSSLARLCAVPITRPRDDSGKQKASSALLWSSNHWTCLTSPRLSASSGQTGCAGCSDMLRCSCRILAKMIVGWYNWEFIRIRGWSTSMT